MQPNPMPTTTRPGPERPTGLNHLVLNVRDIEESHRFWTEILGFQHVGSLRPRSGQDIPRRMRFYSADRNGQLSHHDIALIERPSLWAEASEPQSTMDHVAIAMADRDSWLRHLEFLHSRGITITARFNRGVSESVHIADPNGHDIEIMYERPRDSWADDIEAALNTAKRVIANEAPARSMKAPAMADEQMGG